MIASVKSFWKMVSTVLRIFILILQTLKQKIFGRRTEKNMAVYKLITFVYLHVINFLKNKFETKTVITKKKLNNIFNLMFGDVAIHYSHVTVETIDYAHNFCNRKVRETQILILILSLHTTFSV